MTEIYRDADENPISLEKLVKQEPEWAASRIRFMESEINRLSADAARYRFIRQADPDAGPYIGKEFCSEWGKWTTLNLTSDQADKVVDEAMQTEKDTPKP